MRHRLSQQPGSPAAEVEVIVHLLDQALERADSAQLHLLGAKIDEARHIAERIAADLPATIAG